MSDMKDDVFMKNFILMIAGLILLAVVIYFIAQSVGDKAKVAKSSAGNATVAERIKPVGTVSIATKVMNAVVPVAQAADGKATYDSACAACHASGAAGAPKLGDKAAWKDRIAQGAATLHDHAIKGFQGKVGFMPAKGGNASLSDDAVKAAVDYMVSGSK